MFASLRQHKLIIVLIFAEYSLFRSFPETAEQLSLFRLLFCENLFSRCFIGKFRLQCSYFNGDAIHRNSVWLVSKTILKTVKNFICKRNFGLRWPWNLHGSVLPVVSGPFQTLCLSRAELNSIWLDCSTTFARLGFKSRAMVELSSLTGRLQKRRYDNFSHLVI